MTMFNAELERYDANVIKNSGIDVLMVLKGFRTVSGENTKLFYGVELETECPYKGPSYPDRIDTANKVQMLFKDTAILKFEGTVNNGFEIVTIPASLNYHKEHLWNAFFKTGTRLVSSKSSNCGLHIHFSKDALTDVQLAKVIFFMHEYSNKFFLTTMAGRTVGIEGRYCQQIKKTYGEGKEASTIYEASCNKYQAINISSRNKGKTCEVRIFQGTTRPSIIYKNLEFVDALIAYCGVSPNTEDHLSYDKFCEWFTAEHKQLKYPYLNRFLIRKKYIKGTILTLKDIAKHLTRNVKVS